MDQDLAEHALTHITYRKHTGCIGVGAQSQDPWMKVRSWGTRGPHLGYLESRAQSPHRVQYPESTDEYPRSRTQGPHMGYPGSSTQGSRMEYLG